MVMRETAKQQIAYYQRELDLSGSILEVGGFRLDQCAIKHWPEPKFEFTSLDFHTSDIPNVIVGDITDAKDIPDESFDFVWSSDVFEHIDRPWLAASEIVRILKPGGIAFTHTVWAWRNHPCPIDYWRYSPECLEFLFDGLETVEKGYDLSARRNNNPGFWPAGTDSVPIDALGGWREHWAVFHVGRKGPARTPKEQMFVPYKFSDAKLAHFMRMDTQGTVTNPKLLGKPATEDPVAVSARLDRIEKSLSKVGKQLDQQRKRQEQSIYRRSLRPTAGKVYRKLKAKSGR